MPDEDSDKQRAAEAQAQEDTERGIEDLARELANKIRSAKNRHELTDYAVSVLRESSEESDQADLVRDTEARRDRKRDPFNPIAFGIPLLVIGAVLAMTGLLTGIGLVIIGIALAMVAYGFLVTLVFRGRGSGQKRDTSS